MNGLQAYRCLNTLSEHVDFCSTYTLTNQVYSCSGCESGNELKMVPIGSENQPRCLNTLTQIVLNCASYVADGANGFACSSCDSGFTLKTVSGISKCLPNIVIDNQCTTYILNGANFECGQCDSLYTVSSV